MTPEPTRQPPPAAAPHAGEAPAAVELQGVSKRLGRTLVLRELRLHVAAGRGVVLRGSNGAGKTTLLRVLATRLRPTAGRGEVLGFDLIRQADAVRRRVGLVSVLGGNYAVLTARENLRLAAVLGGSPDVDVDDALARVGLGGVRDQLARTFSSGMKKRLGLARLWMLDPPLWLLDEPYAALDEAGKALVDAALEDARGRGRTVLMASHERTRSRRFADAVLELDAGHLRRLDPEEDDD